MKNFQDTIKTIGGFAVIALFVILFVFIWTGSILAFANTSTEAPFRTIEEFLTRSRKHSHPDIKLDYGTRSEHSSDITLKDYLEENGKLEEFLELWKNLKD